jgi:hypothetical protein
MISRVRVGICSLHTTTMRLLIQQGYKDHSAGDISLLEKAGESGGTVPHRQCRTDPAGSADGILKSLHHFQQHL